MVPLQTLNAFADALSKFLSLNVLSQASLHAQRHAPHCAPPMHRPMHGPAYPSTQKLNPTPPHLYGMGLHDTAALGWR